MPSIGCAMRSRRSASRYSGSVFVDGRPPLERGVGLPLGREERDNVVASREIRGHATDQLLAFGSRIRPCGPIAEGS